MKKFFMILTQNNRLTNIFLNFNRSQAIKPRHWAIISKTCGFQAIVNGQLVTENMFLEEFMALNLDRQVHIRILKTNWIPLKGSHHHFHYYLGVP